MTNEILTIRKVAELLKINEKTAYKLASAGKIPGFKVGGSRAEEFLDVAGRQGLQDEHFASHLRPHGDAVGDRLAAQLRQRVFICRLPGA